MPTLTAEEPQPGQSRSGNTPTEQPRQKGKGQPTQRSGIQPPQPGQDETGVKVTNRSVPPVWRTEQPALQTPIFSSLPVEVPGTTRRVTRRKVLIGLAVGLAIAGGGTAWWELSHGSFGSPVTTSGTSAQANGTATAQASASVPGGMWYAQTSGTSQDLLDVAWSGSQFVAVGYSGTILTSPNGSTWTAQKSGTSQILWHVAWSGSQFVAVGQTGTILNSP